MNCLAFNIAGVMAVLGFVPLFGIQLLPPKMVLTSGGVAYAKNLRVVFPGVTFHMLSKLGKSLLVSSYALWSFAGLLVVTAYFYC